MSFLAYLSNFGIPLIFFFIVLGGLVCRIPVYDCFVKGAKEGLKTTAGILPTLVGLMVAVGVLRASGFLDLLSTVLEKVVGDYFPAEVVPLGVVRMFSASAATGLLLDLFKQFGPDSFEGLVASLLLSGTETLVYCMSIYFGHVKIKKTRYTAAGALLATLAGIIASVFLARLLLQKRLF